MSASVMHQLMSAIDQADKRCEVLSQFDSDERISAFRDYVSAHPSDQPNSSGKQESGDWDNWFACGRIRKVTH
jgi:hypothetical protein